MAYRRILPKPAPATTTAPNNASNEPDVALSEQLTTGFLSCASEHPPAPVHGMKHAQPDDNDTEVIAEAHVDKQAKLTGPPDDSDIEVVAETHVDQQVNKQVKLIGPPDSRRRGLAEARDRPKPKLPCLVIDQILRQRMRDGFEEFRAARPRMEPYTKYTCSLLTIARIDEPSLDLVRTVIAENIEEGRAVYKRIRQDTCNLTSNRARKRKDSEKWAKDLEDLKAQIIDARVEADWALDVPIWMEKIQGRLTAARDRLYKGGYDKPKWVVPPGYNWECA